MSQRSVVLLASLVILAAGCGGSGGGGSSAAEKRAALDKWTAAADGACRKANKAIAERGWPVSLVDLDRLTVRALADFQAASDAIHRLKAPKGSEDRIVPFIKSLDALKPRTDELSEATEDFRTAKLEDFLPELKTSLHAVEKESEKLGLRDCAANDEHTWVPDAIRAPVYAQQLALLNRRVGKRIDEISRPASTPTAVARNFDRLSAAIGAFDKGFARLKPPYWAEDAAGRYLRAVRDLGSALDRGSSELSDSVISLPQAKRVDARIAGAIKKERKAYKRLVRNIGAVPTIGGGGGGDEEEVPGTDGTQES